MEQYWYDIDSVTDKLIPMENSPSPKNYKDTYPVTFGNGYIYFNTKFGAMFVVSTLANLEGKKIILTIK